MPSERLEIKTKDPLRIACIGDVHAPYTSRDYFGHTVSFIKETKPTHIIQIGDLYDQYAYSRYTKSINGLTPRQEDKEGRELASQLWSSISRFAPSAVKIQMLGNHCIRMKKRILEKAPELEDAVEAYMQKLFTFKGVRTMEDDRSELVINDILFIHGYLSNLGDHMRLNRASVVVGHSHRGGTVFMRHGAGTLFELNCGHIADDKLLPFSYTQQRTTFWTPGIGFIETLRNGLVSPRFVPF